MSTSDLTIQFKKLSSWAILELPNGSSITFGEIINALLVLLLGFLLAQFIRYLLNRKLATSKLRPDVVNTLNRVSSYIVYILIGLTVLGVLGIPTSTFAFATGAIAIGVGFGAQNIINNFISGWILLTERPIRVNDFIEIEGAYGTVQRIGTRSTKIHRTDGVHLMVPNSKLLENTVTNWTLVDDLIRSSMKLGVAYGSNVELVRSVLESVMVDHPLVMDKPKPEVVFEDFGSDALIFEMFFWASVSAEKSLRQIRSDLRFEVSTRFASHEIVIAFPQRDIHIKSNDIVAAHTESKISS